MIELVKPLPASKKTLHSLSQSQLSNQQLGSVGEERTVIFLRNLKYHILARNFRSGRGEIDIIALDQELDEVVFIEVKTRSSSYYGDPSLAVRSAKTRILVKTARAWMKKHPWVDTFRFDIVAVLPSQIHHFTNVTW